MNNNQSDQRDTLLFSLSDIGLLCRQKKSKILFFTLVTALLCSFAALRSPVSYKVEATFKEKGRSSAGVGGSLSSILGFGSGNQDNEAISLMRSRKQMIPIVRELGLQAVIVPQGKPRAYFQWARDNITTQWAHFMKKKVPIFPDATTKLTCREITFDDEVSLTLKVHFQNSTTYEVLDHKKNRIGNGQLGRPFTTDAFTFTLYPKETEITPGEQFAVVLQPLNTIAHSYAQAIEIGNDEDDPGLLKLEFSHQNRHFAATFLNKVMEHYQIHLRDLNDQRANFQLAYLKKRRKESDKELTDVLTEHAVSLSNDVYETGFPDTSKEMDFLLVRQKEIKRRLGEIDLEKRRIHRWKSEGDSWYEKVIQDGEGSGITSVLNKIRTYKQQRDAIDLSLRQKPTNDNLRDGLDIHVDALESLHEQTNEVRELQRRLKADEPFPTALKLYDDPSILVSAWVERLETATTGKIGEDVEVWARQRASFEGYLENLARVFTVRANIISQRLAHQQSPTLEFQGIDIETAGVLFKGYQQELEILEETRRQMVHVLQDMGTREYDISSLSATLEDSVSREMIGRSIELLLELRDEQNRSEREQSRLGSALSVQREFLISHLEQQLELLELREGLLQEKKDTIQRTLFDLVHQQITILERHVADFIAGKEATLEQEQMMLDEDMGELRVQMASLPARWTSEQRVEVQKNISEQTLKEVAKLVESKNISHNLEIIESAPVDIAVAPILPKNPQIPLYLFIGVFLGATLSVTLVVLQGIVSGIPVSAANLRMHGQRVAGQLSYRCQNTPSKNLSNEDLETMRQVIRFLPAKKGSEVGKHLIALNTNGGPDYSLHLAKLLFKQGSKVLVLRCTFDQAASTEECPGLLQVLEGEAKKAKVIERGDYDLISAGGISRYSTEQLSSDAFSLFVDKLREKYDYILAVNHSPSTSAEASGLLAQADAAAVTINNEIVQDLSIHLDDQDRCPVIFMLGSNHDQ